MTTVSPHRLITAPPSHRPDGNVTFYTSALGPRLVKQAVKFDAPDT